VGGDVVLFSGAGQLNINTQAGVVYANLGDSGSYVESSISIADGTWHYVTVAFEQFAPGSPNTGGALRLYIDGGLFDELNVAPSTAASTGTCQLGISTSGSGPVDIASWTYYAIAADGDVLDVPGWGEPPADSEAAHGLVAAWDFANGAAVDLAPNPTDMTVTAGPLTWCTDCTQVPYDPEGAGIVPAAADGLNPGGAGAFTVMGWVAVPQGAEANVFSNQFTDNTYVSLSAWSTQVSYDAGGQTETYTLPAATEDFQHVALTYDGQSFNLYVNGTLAQGPTAIAISEKASAAIYLAGCMQATVAHQNVSVWSRALSASEIAMYAGSGDPTTAPGLVAHYNLMFGAQTINSTTQVPGVVNSVTWNAGSVSTAAVVGIELRTAVTAADSARALAAVRPAAETPDIRLMRYRDYRALAIRNGIDVDAMPTAADLATPEYAAFVAHYETTVQHLPPKLADRMRRLAYRNLHVAMQLKAKGVRAGSFEVAHDGPDTVVRYLTPDGPQEMWRLQGELLDNTAQVFLTVFLDLVGVVTAMFGVITGGKAMQKAAEAFESVLETIGETAKNAIQGLSSQSQQAVQAIFAFLYYLWNLKALPTLAYKILSGMSWWKIALNALSLVTQLVSVVASGGAMIAVKIAQIAIAIAQLIGDLLSLPSDSEKSGTAPPALA
jgi:hypothetical protein